jgi:hypothetical protein
MIGNSMQKKRKIDVSYIRMEKTDTNQDLMRKVREAFPRILKDVARSVGEQSWGSIVPGAGQNAMRKDWGGRAKGIRDAALEFLRTCTVEEKQRIAERMFDQLKVRRDLLNGKY